ncbi:3'-5' exonuclease [Alginatibacterium sediminis]|uniref:DNA-directed DNA polymerase n=1 Tax=Alginatibacterium sediminis TaxID=2164068 RepID=A0A420EE00_9ALTE|nr:3'-5' exonuclease [Alginatibacterium sediminis]RKF18898.1 3'-5' exonuclease [Alginatibacterium sediminis]
MTFHSAANVIVLDFETTGLSPTQGDRAIEIGAVKIESGQITDTFSRLMNPGFRVSSFIENYTGISNHMLLGEDECAAVMDEFADFIGDMPLVAHNASFDKRFLDAELDAIQRTYPGIFACSMLIARRLYPNAPNHKLGSLIDYKNIAHDGVFHRALADSEMTAKLWLSMLEDLNLTYQIENPSFKLMQRLARTPKKDISRFLSSQLPA